jgi:hypothetical protein
MQVGSDDLRPDVEQLLEIFNGAFESTEGLLGFQVSDVLAEYTWEAAPARWCS